MGGTKAKQEVDIHHILNPLQIMEMPHISAKCYTIVKSGVGMLKKDTIGNCGKGGNQNISTPATLTTLPNFQWMQRSVEHWMQKTLPSQSQHPSHSMKAPVRETRTQM